MSRDSKLKKALIATWVECDNYGSILQAYCLQEVLKELFSTEKVNRVEKGDY